MARGRKPRVQIKRRVPRRRPALAGIKQGTMVAARPGLRRSGGNGGGGAGFPNALLSLDAFHPSHLPLPRAVGPYCVIRTTSQMQMQAPISTSGTPGSLYLIGSWAVEEFVQSASPTAGGSAAPISGTRHAWTSTFALGWEDGVGLITNGNLAEATMFPHGAIGPTFFSGTEVASPLVNVNGSFQSCTLVPSAVSLQLTNAESVQGSSGLAYACRLNTQFDWSRGPDGTGQLAIDDFANAIISYNQPRILPAAKLAFRGVKADCVPYNMAALADFLPIRAYAKAREEGGVTANIKYGPLSIQSRGFAPVFVYLPRAGNGEQPLTLQGLVCTEWRLRFDPLNPAQASHITHPTTSDNVWNRLQHAMSSQGHGVMDLVEQVANWGTRAAGVYRQFGRARALANGGAQMLALGA